jgi:hypothetical protein
MILAGTKGNVDLAHRASFQLKDMNEISGFPSVGPSDSLFPDL